MRHGHTAGDISPTWRSWRSMRLRCSGNTRYRARGITICERWELFENFLADMGERPPGKTLDRINNDGNYEPGNCRWATPKEQIANRRPFVAGPKKRGYRLDLSPTERAARAERARRLNAAKTDEDRPPRGANGRYTKPSRVIHSSPFEPPTYADREPRDRLTEDDE